MIKHLTDKTYDMAKGLKTLSVDEYEGMQEEIDRLSKEVEKLKDCVAFYAEGHHFNHDDTSIIRVDFENGSKIRSRMEGKKARQCLKELKA